MTPRRLIYSLIGLGLLMAGAILGEWLVPPAQPGDEWPRWIQIAGVAVGTPVFVAWSGVMFVMGLHRLDVGPRGVTPVGILIVILISPVLALLHLAIPAMVVCGLVSIVLALIG